MFEIKDKDIKPTEYLYGVSPLHFKDMTYKETLQAKIELAKEQVKKLAEHLVWNMDYEKWTAVNTNIKDCLKALQFNSKLLEEYEKAEKTEKAENGCNGI